MSETHIERIVARQIEEEQMPIQAADVRQLLRQQMCVSNRFAYFDHAAVAPIPKVTAEAIESYAQTSRDYGDVKWLTWSSRLAILRGCVGRLINAHTDEIALVGNTTQGLNIVAEALPWKSGDNVVVPSNEFPSNSLPWRNLKYLGVELRQIPVSETGEINLDALDVAIDSGTRLISLSWVGYASGFRCNVEEVVEFAHDRNCLVMLDAIQGIGAFPLDVKRTGIDFLCADGHKWMLGPEGAGLLFIKAEHLGRMRPVGVGWASLKEGSFDPDASELKETAARYEGGTSNMPGMLGLAASLDLLDSLGAGLKECPISAAILENVALLEQRLTESGFHVHVSPTVANRSGIVGVTWPDDNGQHGDYHAARKFCLARDVVVSVRGERLRVSTHAYNDAVDIERLVEALIEFRRAE